MKKSEVSLLVFHIQATFSSIYIPICMKTILHAFTNMKKIIN